MMKLDIIETVMSHSKYETTIPLRQAKQVKFATLNELTSRHFVLQGFESLSDLELANVAFSVFD